MPDTHTGRQLAPLECNPANYNLGWRWWFWLPPHCSEVSVSQESRRAAMLLVVISGIIIIVRCVGVKKGHPLVGSPYSFAEDEILHAHTQTHRRRSQSGSWGGVQHCVSNSFIFFCCVRVSDVNTMETSSFAYIQQGGNAQFSYLNRERSLGNVACVWYTWENKSNWEGHEPDAL